MRIKTVLLLLVLVASNVFLLVSNYQQNVRMIPFTDVKIAATNFCDENSVTLNIYGKTDYSHGNARGKLDTNNTGLGVRYNCTKYFFVGGDFLQNPIGDKVTLLGVGLHGTAFKIGDFAFGGGVMLLDMKTTAPKVEVKKEEFPDAPFIRKTIRIYKVNTGGVYEVPFLEVTYGGWFTVNVAPLPATKNKTSGEIFWIGITQKF